MQSERFSEEETSYWLKVKREAHLGSLQPLEDAAKQIVVITSLLQGIYFAAISISDIKKVNDTTNVWFDAFIVLSMLTLGLWMASLYFATRVFLPRVYDARLQGPDPEDEAREVRTVYKKTSSYKYRRLKCAAWLLWLSFLPFAINVLIYLARLRVPPPK